MLITLAIGAFFAPVTAHALFPALPTQQEEGEPRESPSSEPMQPSIPKPKTLPGPLEETQKAGGEETRQFFFQDLIPGFSKGFLGIVGVTAVVFLIVGGIQFLIAFGNEEKLGTAKKTITWALIGLVFSILSYAIVAIITSLPLPTERGAAGTSVISADININELLPPESELIEGHRSGKELNVSLPSGRFKEDLIPAVIRLILLSTGTIAFIVFTVAGVMLVVAHGNEEQTKKVKNIFLYAILGLIIIAVSYGIVFGIMQLRFS